MPVAGSSGLTSGGRGLAGGSTVHHRRSYSLVASAVSTPMTTRLLRAPATAATKRGRGISALRERSVDTHSRAGGDGRLGVRQLGRLAIR